jgi:dipeptidyl aminopeptidase/acylaminoacyl peptidase
LEFSPDNRYAILLREGMERDTATVSHVTVVPLAGGKPISILESAEAPHSFSVSPNGKWVAYESRESQRHEVYVRSFPTGAASVQVSTDGGNQPKWSPDGRRVVYQNDKLFREATLDFTGSVPRVVHTDTIFASQQPGVRRIVSYAVHPDGKHFVVSRDATDETKLVVVTNWISEVRAKLSGK